MNHSPKNTTFISPEGKAELFFQVVNCDHILSNYVEDLDKPASKRAHDVVFKDLIKRLRGEVLFGPFEDKKKKYYALSLVDERYYYTVFYLDRRADSEQLFAIIITCYATNNKDIHQRYDRWLKAQKEKFNR